MKYHTNNRISNNENCYNCNKKNEKSFPWHIYNEPSSKLRFDFVNKESNVKTSVKWVIIKTHSESLNQIENQFNELAAKWKNETGLFSTTYQKVLNDSYLDIIGMGKVVVPLILKDMQTGSIHWHTALKAITKENPIPDNDVSKSKKVKEAWLNWGRSKNLI